MRKRILDAARRMALALSSYAFVLAAVAQSPSADAFNPAPNDAVDCLAVQADGKILVAGGFTRLGGQSRNYIGRLNADGTLDSSFNLDVGGGIFPPVFCLAVQADGKILVAGGFSTLGGQSRTNIGRLNSDGTLDTSFNPEVAGGGVDFLALQADGKMLVGGLFSTLGGQSRTNIGRLNGDGTLDTSFNPTVTSYTSLLALQTDGKILVGGWFSPSGGQTDYGFYIGRLNADGTLDTSFNPTAANDAYFVTLQADGKILVAGAFGVLGGQSRYLLGRLNADGTLDTTFNPGVVATYHPLDVYQPFVQSLAVQADGKILVGGRFTDISGQTRWNIGRLNADGTLDATFDPQIADTYPYVSSLVVQGDGRILVGGSFSTLGGQRRTNIGRLNNTGPATQSLTFDGSTVTWMRAGTSPEVWRTTFEYSPDGTSWTNLRAGTRIPGGWQLSGLALPPNTILRARGYTAGGSWETSGGFVESFTGPPRIVTQPGSLTNNAGTTAALSVYASGSGPLSYEWRKDGQNLADGGSVSGSATANLTLNNVLGGDGAAYSVVITNAVGSVTSAVATLGVIDPLITVQPASQTRSPGDSVTLSVKAAGTPPLRYQWRKDGDAQAGATQSSLTLTNLQVSDAGSYDAVVSDAWGSATSTVALLSVNAAFPDAFNPGVDGYVNSWALQADGKILVGGSFSTLGGQSRTNIGRLNADGTLDTNFNPGADGGVFSLGLQADGKILVGGNFLTLGGQSRTSIGRLNADGTVDTSFNPGTDYDVESLAVQVDGKILVGGSFSTLGGQSRTNIGRLNENGTLDTNFNPGAGGGVFSLALQADGRILVAGDFTTLAGQSCTNIGRLNADGTVDTNFNPGADDVVNSLALQADGRILVGGDFWTLGGQSRKNIGRLNADGTLDTNFNPGADGGVFSLGLQADGKILVGGNFLTLGGQSRTSIGRLNADGTVDTSFNPGTDYDVESLAVQVDGKILVAGDFWTLGGRSSTNIGRLNNTGPANQSLTFDGSALTWMRGGTSPEVWRTTFEYSPDGTSWTYLGAGIRIPGGWQLSGLVLPTNTIFRARGYTAGGQHNSSGWFVETMLRPTLVISDMRQSGNGDVGFNASGPFGQVVVIEASPDLRTWTALRTNTLGANPLPFSDSQAAVVGNRFYRLRGEP